MLNPRFILLGSMSMFASMSAAQQAINIAEDFELPAMFVESELEQVGTSTRRSQFHLETISLEQLSMMRSAGLDPSWIDRRFEFPEFNPSSPRLTQSDHQSTLESWATHYTDADGLQLGENIRFSVGRTTELRDGNISGSDTSLSGSKDGHVASVAQSEGEYDIYDLAVEWEAVHAGPVTVSVYSGLKAIEANIGKKISIDGEQSIDKVHRFTAIPMIGSGVRWQISDSLSISGAALTHPIETGDALIDFNASTDLRISKNVGLITGYRIIRSNFEVGSVETDVTQEGLFARLEISF